MVLGVLGGCRLDVTVDLVVEADGTGELTVTAIADPEVVEQAPGLADDVRFDDAIAAGWVVDGPSATADGGLTVTLRHPVTSDADATNVLASLGPPFAGVRVERTAPSPEDDETTVLLSGQLNLPAGFDSFADADLLAAVGGSPYASDLDAAGATPDRSMSAALRVSLPGEIEETTGTDTDGVLVWEAPLDGTSTEVAALSVQRPAGGGWSGPVSTIVLVLLVAWVAAAAAFIVSVGRARSRRARARRRRRAA